MLAFLLTKFMVAIESHMNSYGVEDWNHVLPLGHCAHCRERNGERQREREGGEREREKRRERGGTGKQYCIINMALWSAITYNLRDLARPH